MERVKELYIQLDESTDDQKRLDILAELATRMLNSDLERCASLIKELHNIAIRVASDEGMYLYNNTSGQLFLKRAEYVDAEISFNQAYRLALKMGDKKKQGSILYSLGILWVNLGRLDDAIDYVKRALELLEPNEENGTARFICFMNLAVAYDQQMQHDLAESAYQECIKLLELPKVAQHEGPLLINYASLKYRQKQYDACIAFNNRALELALKDNNRAAEAYVYGNLGIVYLALGDTANALKVLLVGKKLVQTIKVKKLEVAILTSLGRVYSHIGGYKEASEYFEKALSLNETFEYPKGLTSIYGSWGEMYAQMGDYELADTMLKRALDLANKHHFVEDQITYSAKLAEIGNTSTGNVQVA